MTAFESLLTAWDGEQVAVRYEADLDTWMFIGVHSTRRGPTGGGTRMRSYASPEDALADVLELSSAMTRKFAVCDVPRGGGKAVLAVPELPTGEARTKLLHRYGEFITSLGGLYSCAPDMNTSEHDMDIIAETCPYVFCKTVEKGGSGSTAPATAKGVFHGIEASVQHALGSDLKGVRVLVQGMGSVGALLAAHLDEAGADLYVSDVDDTRLTVGTPVAPDEVVGFECDVLAPCATGGVINAVTIDQLRCRVIAGAANNQLAVAVTRRPAARARNPLRARLRHQRRRRAPRRGPRVARLDGGSRSTSACAASAPCCSSSTRTATAHPSTPPTASSSAAYARRR